MAHRMTRDDVAYVARLARLHLTDDELARELANSFLAYIGIETA